MLLDECDHLMERTDCVLCNGRHKEKAKDFSASKLNKVHRTLANRLNVLEIEEVPWKV